MQIPSFVPKITPGVVGFSPSSSYHLGFVCVCMCARTQAVIPPPHNLPGTDTLPPPLPRLYTHWTGHAERMSDPLKRPNSCLPASDFYMFFKSALRKKKISWAVSWKQEDRYQQELICEGLGSRWLFCTWAKVGKDLMAWGLWTFLYKLNN